MKAEARDGQYCRHRVEPHPKRPRHLWPAPAQHHHADRLHDKLQQNADYDQRGNYVSQPQEAEQHGHATQCQQRTVGKRRSGSTRAKARK